MFHPEVPAKANMGGFTQITTASEDVYAVMKKTAGDTRSSTAKTAVCYAMKETAGDTTATNPA
jgi:hypothetical protein